MNNRICRMLGAVVCLSCLITPALAAEEEIGLTLQNGVKEIKLPLVSGVDSFNVLSTTDLGIPFKPSSGNTVGYAWTQAGLAQPHEFFLVELLRKDSNAVVAATMLNRMGYGPTPDDLARVTQIGADAYLAEQLAPENIQESLPYDEIDLSTDWQFVTMTGTASSSTLYIYLSGVGDCYIDDLKLVRGSVPEVGQNMIRNGTFDSNLSSWTVSPILTNSVITTAEKKVGAGALHIISTDNGSTRESSIYQDSLGLSSGQTYTLSYWFKPGASRMSSLTIRLSGSGIVSSPGTLATKLAFQAARIEDLRAWHVLHAVESKKQLLEVLLQFLENHFVTQHRKSAEYLDRFLPNEEINAAATHLEYREIERWRQALLNPQCTFHDLLKISAESPAMIIYLDTVDSRGNGSNIANENYARELLELFTFGVDNGYHQEDITIMSRAWTGWSVRLVHPTNEFNPFAPQSSILRPGMTDRTRPDNLEGVWAFAYKANNHNNNSKIMFPAALVPSRFGPPYAGRNYQLALPARSGTNSIQDGYAVLRHLADQPFTQEYISVKLCRLFVHDDFRHGYDFSDEQATPEEALVRACMEAWENGSPKGQIRQVLEVIFKSELFRSEAMAMQKVKTPFEFGVSAIRTLRGTGTNLQPTARTDGYSLYNLMNLAGRMRLFDRDDPDGYAEEGAAWISAGTLAERLRFVQAYLLPPGTSGRDDAGDCSAYPVELLRTKLSTQMNNPRAVAEFFCSIIFPAEGKANLDEYRRLAEQYLNSASGASGDTVNVPFSNLSSSGTSYDYRVRGMVAMLMTLQRFQEQ